MAGDESEHHDDLIDRDAAAAVVSLREQLARDPLNARVYRLLAQALQAAQSGERRGQVHAAVQGMDETMMRASMALSSGDLETAEIILRRRLLEHPSDVLALHMMAGLASALDFSNAAVSLLELVLEIAPDFTPSSLALAAALNKLNLPLAAVEALDPVLQREPDNRMIKALQATAFGRAGRFDQALRLHEELLQTNGDDPKLWSSYGHFLKTVGRSEEGYHAMRHAVDLAPANGEAWWTLSNLKTTRLETSDIAIMTKALAATAATDHDRFHLHFALGKAHEDAGAAEVAFDHYFRGNAIRRAATDYPVEAFESEISASIKIFDHDFFEQRGGLGATERDPIFVVGMPRAGSTLIEQILASHPEIEGTSELPIMPMIAKNLERGSDAFFTNLAALDAAGLRALGEEYLEATRVYRTTGRPLFVDKMPNNWRHIPLIHLILPNAKIIDARRHPLACGFSNFRQLYADGHTFSYDLALIGRHYANYVRFLAHIDAVLPNKVHRVIHERLVDDTEAEIRRMLQYLELPFDVSCLRFYETDRAVRTPSSEQVRRPINRKALDDWRMFEPWLGPLKAALGPVLDAYPDEPPFAD